MLNKNFKLLQKHNLLPLEKARGRGIGNHTRKDNKCEKWVKAVNITE